MSVTCPIHHPPTNRSGQATAPLVHCSKSISTQPSSGGEQSRVLCLVPMSQVAEQSLHSTQVAGSDQIVSTL